MHFVKLTSRATIILYLLCSLASLTSCGNKGPLYIPEPPVEQQSAPQGQQESEQS